MQISDKESGETIIKTRNAGKARHRLWAIVRREESSFSKDGIV